MRVAVVVPWRDKGDPLRRRNYDYVAERLRGGVFTDVVISGDGRTGNAPFNRSRAYNDGRAEVEADVYIWHEADMIVPFHQLAEGVIIAASRPGVVVPFDTYRYLTEAASDAVLAGTAPHDVEAERVMAGGRSVGAVTITSAETMRLVGQWDEVFEGWGYDDTAMFAAFQKAAGEPHWVPGPGHHLYHTPGWQAGERFAGGAARISPTERAATRRNKARLALYRAATTPEQIRALTLGV